MILNDGGQEEVQHVETDEQNHQGEEDICKHNRPIVTILERHVLLVFEWSVEIELRKSKVHHKGCDQASPVICVICLFVIIAVHAVLQNPKTKRKPMKENSDCEEVERDFPEDDVEHCGKVSKGSEA